MYTEGIEKDRPEILLQMETNMDDLKEEVESLTKRIKKIQEDRLPSAKSILKKATNENKATGHIEGVIKNMEKICNELESTLEAKESELTQVVTQIKTALRESAPD